MNKEQDIARFIVEKTKYNLFLTGKAGTGKTTFLRDINLHTKKKHIVLAPTGVAAVNAGAVTIHSFFQFGFGPYIKGVSEPQASFKMQKQKLDLIQNLELLIIDEISMVRADLLDHINDELQRIRKNREPFGGIQLLMVGDLQQLPPVVTEGEVRLLMDHYDSCYFFSSKALRSSEYFCIDLKQVYRQTDPEFIDILNHARDGQMTPKDIKALNARCMQATPPDGSYIHLVTHNAQADSINSARMDALPDDPIAFEADVSGTFPEDSFPTPKCLSIKCNAQVMFVRNDPQHRFVNGTIGTVVEIECESIVVRIAQTDDIVEVQKVEWDNFRYQMDEQTKTIEPKKIGTFSQYPIKPAWAITVHKSQGLTFDRAVIDVHAAFSPGQAYVALSRCRSLEGLVLSAPIAAGIFRTDSTVAAFMCNALKDIDAIANIVGYAYFDYECIGSISTPIRHPSKSPKQKTWAISYEMYKSGKTVAQISRERNITESTIIGHLSRYVESGELDVRNFVSEDILNKVVEYKSSHPDMSGLKELYDYYNGTIPYNDIRVSLAHFVFYASHSRKIRNF